MSVGEGASKEIFVLNGYCAMEGDHVDGSGKLRLKSVHVFRRPFPPAMFASAVRWGLDTAIRNKYIIRVLKALQGDVCFRYTMEGGHGGLMVRKGPAAGSNVSTTAAVRWSGAMKPCLAI